MRESILRELDAVERDRGVRVLLSVESGSRAWGIASSDSDYDVRFVYLRPMRSYLCLEKSRDTIEWKLDAVFDVSGWDLTKLLKLLQGSNPTAFEWLSSPIMYRECPEFARVRELAKDCFSPKASAFHYLGLERGNGKAYLRNETVSAKKYLYMVRALLAARWCLEELTLAPMLLSDLLDAKLPGDLQQLVDDLLAAKLAGKEHCEVARMPQLEAWVEREDADLYALAQAATAPPAMLWEPLDDLFYELLTSGESELA